MHPPCTDHALRFRRPCRKGPGGLARWWPLRPRTRGQGPPWSRRPRTSRRSFDRRLPVYSDKRTFSKSVGMSQGGQKPTSLDHLVGAGKDDCRNLQPNQFCSFQIDNKPKLGWLLYRKLCRFCALKILSTWPAALRKIADQTGPYDINAPAGRKPSAGAIVASLFATANSAIRFRSL
jgi:hypothetical protein